MFIINFTVTYKLYLLNRIFFNHIPVDDVPQGIYVVGAAVLIIFRKRIFK